MRRPPLNSAVSTPTQDTEYTCPHCGVLQVAAGLSVDVNAIRLTVLQCRNCRDISLDGEFYQAIDRGRWGLGQARFYPANQARPAKVYKYCPPEVTDAYEDACKLFAYHAGAAGAYARRAMELILDNAGYVAKTLADSIALAEKEKDPDKRLNRNLILKLNYVKEIGNFALHVRRDDELAIVAISKEEVSACLETVEDLITARFEEPGFDYERTVALNEKLKAANKKEIPLPVAPAYGLGAGDEKNEDAAFDGEKDGRVS